MNKFFLLLNICVISSFLIGCGSSIPDEPTASSNSYDINISEFEEYCVGNSNCVFKEELSKKTIPLDTNAKIIEGHNGDQNIDSKDSMYKNHSYGFALELSGVFNGGYIREYDDYDYHTIKFYIRDDSQTNQSSDIEGFKYIFTVWPIIETRYLEFLAVKGLDESSTLGRNNKYYIVKSVDEGLNISDYVINSYFLDIY